MFSPVEVLSGIPFDEAERAIALLRAAGIPVGVRKVVEGRWVYVAAADEKQALALLAAHRFPAPMALAHAAASVRRSVTGPAPGDDVWELLTQKEPAFPIV
ncbi:MAG: hypothetical protein WB493_12170 [Anaeromyxobacteraceae bacterium]